MFTFIGWAIVYFGIGIILASILSYLGTRHKTRLTDSDKASIKDHFYMVLTAWPLFVVSLTVAQLGYLLRNGRKRIDALVSAYLDRISGSKNKAPEKKRDA